jgi:hypothetical protein
MRVKIPFFLSSLALSQVKLTVQMSRTNINKWAYLETIKGHLLKIVFSSLKPYFNETLSNGRI